ncbi:hypothetical protein, partial [Phaeobacter sp.]|uniref:hypothetical protein n=1 Tax=Phaeobacter sp. TaxID=1902409 RepID=UPI0025D5DC80
TTARTKATRPTTKKGETDRNNRLITETRKWGILLRHFWGFLKRHLQTRQSTCHVRSPLAWSSGTSHPIPDRTLTLPQHK